MSGFAPSKCEVSGFEPSKYAKCDEYDDSGSDFEGSPPDVDKVYLRQEAYDTDSSSGSESDEEKTADVQGDSIAAVRLAKYEQCVRDYKVDVRKDRRRTSCSEGLKPDTSHFEGAKPDISHFEGAKPDISHFAARTLRRQTLSESVWRR
jgi:hypothetical protein